MKLSDQPEQLCQAKILMYSHAKYLTQHATSVGTLDCRNRKAHLYEAAISDDVCLALDYVLSMQYFRIFRCDENSCLVSYEESTNRLLDSDRRYINDFLSGLQSGTFSSDEQRALRVMLRLPLQVALKSENGAEEPWIETSHRSMRDKFKLSGWVGLLSTSTAATHWSNSDKDLLIIWLHNKLQSEKVRPQATQQAADHMRLFSETDRLVGSLIARKIANPAEFCTPIEYSGMYNAVMQNHKKWLSNTCLMYIMTVACLQAALSP